MSKKDVRQLLRRLHRQGFTIRIARSGHYRVTGPCGGVVTVASSPHGGRRSLANARAALRRIGAQL